MSIPNLPIIPLFYGHASAAWPAGTYWLVEHVRENAPRLYWMDAENSQHQTGWGYLPENAAGFADLGAAMFAFKQRGRTAVEGGKIEFVQHIWDNSNE